MKSYPLASPAALRCEPPLDPPPDEPSAEEREAMEEAWLSRQLDRREELEDSD